MVYNKYYLIIDSLKRVYLTYLIKYNPFRGLYYYLSFFLLSNLFFLSFFRILNLLLGTPFRGQGAI
jgi:hypothetical protein